MGGEGAQSMKQCNTHIHTKPPYNRGALNSKHMGLSFLARVYRVQDVYPLVYMLDTAKNEEEIKLVSLHISQNKKEPRVLIRGVIEK